MVAFLMTYVIIAITANPKIILTPVEFSKKSNKSFPISKTITKISKTYVHVSDYKFRLTNSIYFPNESIC
jgi:hypothetical protein